jgi:chromosome segregation ATPase
VLDLITKFDEEEAKIYYESDNHINCDKEIERLNKEIEALNKEINKEMALTTEYESKYYDEYDENKRLNNIINELDKFLKDKIDSWKKANDDLIVKDTIYHERLAVRLIYDYLQELKGDGSNE